MRKKITLYSILGLFIIFSRSVAGLQCWQCISDDCEGNPQKNIKAEKISCKKDGSCLKVLYRMHDNKTEYRSVIRTCSSGECIPTPYNEFQACLSKDHGYLVRGCSLRLCCGEDMCNTSHNHSIPVLLLFCLFVLSSYFGFY